MLHCIEDDRETIPHGAPRCGRGHTLGTEVGRITDSADRVHSLAEGLLSISPILYIEGCHCHRLGDVPNQNQH